VLALLFKVFAATVCFAHGDTDRTADAPIAVVTSIGAEANAGDGCILGDTGGCHCTCAHAVPLPFDAALVEHSVPTQSPVWLLTEPQFMPTPLGSLFRPPIA
jgi:hypothetical protein